MSDVIGADASDQDLARNLGTGQQESRSAAFGAGVLASHPGSLAESQERFNDALSHHYMQQGVAQLTANAISAMSAAGISESSPRSYVFGGQRVVLGTGLGRSRNTYDANPMAGQVSD